MHYTIDMSTASPVKYLDETIESLKTLNPVKIILFGSTVRGNTHEWSDLDLLVVLDSDRIPQSYEEKMKIKLAVRKTIREQSYKVPIDLLVYTRPEYEALTIQNSSFINEINSEGKTLYERKS